MKRALLVAMLASCGGAAHGLPAGWRIPAPGAPRRPTLPAVQTFDVDGIPVALVENHRLPIATIAIVHLAAGSKASSPGVAAIAADTIGADLARDGARLEIEIATDAAITTLHADTSNPAALADAANRFGAAIAHPSDDTTLLASARAKRLGDIAQHALRPRTIAAQTFDRIAFQRSGYGIPAEGDDTTIERTDEEIREFRARAYGPHAASIVIAGDLTRERATAVLHAALAGWTGDATAPRPTPLLDYVPMREPVGLPDGVTATDAIVLVGSRSMPPRAELAAAEVANAVVGAGKGSRLDQRLHVELKLTPSISSAFWRGAWDGTWALACSVPPRRATEAVSAITSVVDAARASEPSPAEVELAKITIAHAVAQQFDTADTTARALAQLVAQGRPADDLARYLDEVYAVTPASALAAAQHSFDRLSVVVVGP